VLGLDRGGSCRGVVYRLPAPLAMDELHLLWRREMVTGAYSPRWLHVDCEGRPLIALGFVVKRDHPQYTRKLTIDEQAEVIAHACGAFGSSADYLERTRVSLATHGIVDLYLERLAAGVAARGCIAGTPIEVHAPTVSAANESGS
jgi:cation transport protein ChaC